MSKARDGFLGAYCGMFGVVLAAAFFQGNLIPAGIWVAGLVGLLVWSEKQA
jgi:hypothetical protein